MSRTTMLAGAAGTILGIVLCHRLGLSLGWAVVWTLIGQAVIWSALALLVRRSGSQSARTQTFEMALVAVVGASVLPFVGLGRWLHLGLDLSVTASVWSSIGAGLVALVAVLVVYYKYFD